MMKGEDDLLTLQIRGDGPIGGIVVTSGTLEIGPAVGAVTMPDDFVIGTRTTVVEKGGETFNFQSNGKVLVKAGWLAIYGKEAEAETQRPGAQPERTLPPVRAGEKVQGQGAEVKALQTKPPARYNEATLLGAMEGAGKLVSADELREAMMEKGLGTPATRAAIIEGLLTEKYLQTIGYMENTY